MKRRKFQGDGFTIATLLYGPPNTDPDGQTNLPLDQTQPPEDQEEEKNITGSIP